MTGALKPIEGCQLLSWSKAVPFQSHYGVFLMHTDQPHATKKPGAFCTGKARRLLQREGMPTGPQGAPGGDSRPLQPTLPRPRTSVGMRSKAEVRREKKTGISQRDFAEERGIQDRRVKGRGKGKLGATPTHAGVLSKKQHSMNKSHFGGLPLDVGLQCCIASPLKTEEAILVLTGRRGRKRRDAPEKHLASVLSHS